MYRCPCPLCIRRYDLVLRPTTEMFWICPKHNIEIGFRHVQPNPEMTKMYIIHVIPIHSLLADAGLAANSRAASAICMQMLGLAAKSRAASRPAMRRALVAIMARC